MESFTNVTILTVGIGIGVAMVLAEWVRQRGSLQQKVEELQAWKDSQKLVQDDYNRTYSDSVQLQREGQAWTKENYTTNLRFNERSVALYEARLKVAQEHLDEARRMNDLLSQLVAELSDQSGRGRPDG